MIKFFRKIRHRLLTENKFSKYILYATGEILLVVIGSDQYTKYLAGKLFESSSDMSFFNNFFEFSFVRNHDGFLGIVNNLPENYKFFLLYICVSFLLLGFYSLSMVFGQTTISNKSEIKRINMLKQVSKEMEILPD